MATTTYPTSPFAVFRNRNFTFIWLGQLISTMGSSLASLGAAIIVYRLTGSALSVGLMLMATALPTLFIGPIAGVFVDRYDRKRIMIIVDILRAVLVVLIPFLIPYNIAWLYIIIMLISSMGQFFDPAHASVLPEIASDEELAAANSFIAISSFGSTAIGFAASGLLASQFQIEWAFFLDGLSFLISAVCIMLVKLEPLKVEGRTTVSTVLHNLRDGTKFLFDTQILRSLMILSIPVLFAFGLWNTLLLPFSERAINATEFEYGLQEGLTSIGFVVGSLLMARFAGRLREGRWLTISYILMGLIGVLYSRVVLIPMAFILVTISGLSNAPSAISRRLLVQRHTPREIRGRVNSVFFVSRDVALLVGMAAAGLADVIEIRLLVLICALLILASGVLALFMPGLGQPAAEWIQALNILRKAAPEPSLEVGRTASLSDYDVLTAHLPILSIVSPEDRDGFIDGARVVEAPSGTTIISHGEMGDDAYFVLSGLTVAGIAMESGEYRSLSIMGPGDFFGEIAALTGRPRTANVVAEENSQLLKVHAEKLHLLMVYPQLKYLLWSKLIERLGETHEADFPRLAGLDQESLLELRTPDPGREGQSK